MAEIIEDRTFECLQQDKSVDLNDLTPRHLNDPTYWTEMAYNPGVNGITSIVYLTITGTASPSNYPVGGKRIPAGFKVQTADGSKEYTTLYDVVFGRDRNVVYVVPAISKVEGISVTANQLTKVVEQPLSNITLTVTNPVASVETIQKVRIAFTCTAATTAAGRTIPQSFAVRYGTGSENYWVTEEAVTLNEEGKGETTAINVSKTTVTAANQITNVPYDLTYYGTSQVWGMSIAVTNPEAPTTYSTERDTIHITSAQAVDTSIVVDSSVQPGVYVCIATDRDIIKEKATVENGKVPLCFKRSAVITLTTGETQTVYPWSQKWERIGDLPTSEESDS